MPTTAKLVAAAIFAAIGWLAANAHVPAMGEGADVGRMREISAVIGLIVGWRVMGNLVGQSYADAVGSGLRSVATFAFFALLIFASSLMIGQSTKMIYDGPMDAFLSVFKIMGEEGRKMLTPGVLGVLGVGAVLGGILTEWTARRWR